MEAGDGSGGEALSGAKSRQVNPIARMGMSFQFGNLQAFMIYVQTKANGLSATKEDTLIDSQKAQPRHELVGRP